MNKYLKSLVLGFILKHLITIFWVSCILKIKISESCVVISAVSATILVILPNILWEHLKTLELWLHNKSLVANVIVEFLARTS